MIVILNILLYAIWFYYSNPITGVMPYRTFFVSLQWILLSPIAISKFIFTAGRSGVGLGALYGSFLLSILLFILYPFLGAAIQAIIQGSYKKNKIQTVIIIGIIYCVILIMGVSHDLSGL